MSNDPGPYHWRVDDDDWRQRGLCTQPDVDPDDWYPGRGRGEAVKADKAKRLCRTCDVRTECLSTALDNGERHGIWGGLGERERRRLIEQRNLTESSSAPESSSQPDGSDTKPGIAA